MKREWLFLCVFWLLATAAGVAFVYAVPLMPASNAEEAALVDTDMVFMTVMAVPVFTGVTIMLVYSMFRFRRAGPPDVDGPPIHGNRAVQYTWFGVSTALTLFLAGFGSLGLLDLRGHGALKAAGQEMVVQVSGSRWFWEYTYPAQNITTKEALVLPLGRRVKFEVTAKDVIHSFWVPAFRVKIDAVPGLTTFTYATPNRVGTLNDNVSLRVQCAELCGLAHGSMETPVTVLEPAAFDAWVQEQQRKEAK